MYYITLCTLYRHLDAGNRFWTSQSKEQDWELDPYVWLVMSNFFVVVVKWPYWAGNHFWLAGPNSLLGPYPNIFSQPVYICVGGEGEKSLCGWRIILGVTKDFAVLLDTKTGFASLFFLLQNCCFHQDMWWQGSQTLFRTCKQQMQCLRKNV